MAKTIRVSVTPEMLKKLRDGEPLTFAIPPSNGITHIEVVKARPDGIFGSFDGAFEKMDEFFDQLFGTTHSSK